MAAIINGYDVRDCTTATGYRATHASTSSSSSSICAREPCNTSAQVLPDALHRVDFWVVRRLEYQRHIGWDAQIACHMGRTVVQDQHGEGVSAITEGIDVSYEAPGRVLLYRL